jgi:hypothetical protein
MATRLEVNGLRAGEEGTSLIKKISSDTSWAY